jgi:hypothetical protein
MEEANLLNPAFIAGLTMKSVEGYVSVSREPGMNYALPFIALPLVLFGRARHALPRTTASSLPVWLNMNLELRSLVLNRATALVPYVREGVLYALTYRGLKMTESGTLAPGDLTVRRGDLQRLGSAEVAECFQRADFVGRWFGSSGTPATVMSLWGVRP